MSELAVREELLELDTREADGLRVELLYKKVGKEVLLHITDIRVGEDREFLVPPDQALDAFHHPYAYLRDYPEAA